MANIPSEILVVMGDSRKIRAAYLGALGRDKKGKKRWKNIKARSEYLGYLDHCLLKIHPMIFQDLLFLEWYDQPNQQRPSPLVTQRMFSLASHSVESAKHLARLLYYAISAFLGRFDGMDDVCCQIILGSFLQAESNPLSSARNAHCFCGLSLIRQLITGADNGDEEAHSLLRILWRELAKRAKIAVLPVTPGEYTHEDKALRAEVLDAFSEMRDYREDSWNPSFNLAFAYKDKCYKRLKLVFDQEVARSSPEHNQELDDFHRRMEGISLSAYDNYLTATWDFICAEQTPNLVLSGGRDKVQVNDDYFNHYGFKSFAFSRENPDGGYFPYPEVQVLQFFGDLCMSFALRLTLDKEGRIKEFPADHDIEGREAAMWCLIVDAYAEIVVPTHKKESLYNMRKSRPALLKPHHSAQESIDVRAYFRKLPQGHKATPAQVQQAITEFGMPPAPGYTFVGQSQRGFPGQVLTYEEARSAWEAHRIIKPTLILDEQYIEELLDRIPSFA